MLGAYNTPPSHDSNMTKWKILLDIISFCDFNYKLILLCHDNVITLSFPTKGGEMTWFRSDDSGCCGRIGWGCNAMQCNAMQHISNGSGYCVRFKWRGIMTQHGSVRWQGEKQGDTVWRDDNGRWWHQTAGRSHL